MQNEIKKQIATQVLSHYYTDFEEKELWEPFENWEESNIDELVNTDSEQWFRLIHPIVHKSENLEIREAQLTNALASIVRIVLETPSIGSSTKQAIVNCADGAIEAKEIARELDVNFNKN